MPPINTPSPLTQDGQGRRTPKPDATRDVWVVVTLSLLVAVADRLVG
jgi:hypothetical protein